MSNKINPEIVNAFTENMPEVMNAAAPFVVATDTWQTGGGKHHDNTPRPVKTHEQMIVRVGNNGFSFVMVDGAFCEFAIIKFPGKGNKNFDIVTCDWSTDSAIVRMIKDWQNS